MHRFLTVAASYLVLQTLIPRPTSRFKAER